MLIGHIYHGRQFSSTIFQVLSLMLGSVFMSIIILHMLISIRPLKGLLRRLSYNFAGLKHSFFQDLKSKPKAISKLPQPQRVVPLKQIVTATIQLQEKNQPNFQELISFLKFNNWIIRAEGTRHELIKQLKNRVVSVIFYSQYIKPVRTQPERDSEQTESEQQAQIQSYPIEVTVYIRNKQTLQSAMCVDFQCTSKLFDITNISFTDDYHLHKTIPKYRRPLKDYQGPLIENMTQQKRLFFMQYLNEHGINHELAEFLIEFSSVSEEVFVLEWLKSFQNIF